LKFLETFQNVGHQTDRFSAINVRAAKAVTEIRKAFKPL